MNQLSNEKRAQVIRSLVEGNSIRATCRIAGVAKGTVLKLLVDIGSACADFHDRYVVNVQSKRIQADEIWCFVGCKDANKPAEKQGQRDIGSVWTWTAIDADTKLCVSWFVGTREADSARAFIADLYERVANRIQLTTDGHGAYLNAVGRIFGDDVDFAQLVKTYAAEREMGCRYSPPVCTGCKKTVISGDPDPDHVNTSFVERQNLTMRMSMRRFTRLTNAFSKKLANLIHAVALHFAYYNFCRIHQTLRVTPAMAAGLTDHVWEIEELVGLLEPAESK